MTLSEMPAISVVVPTVNEQADIPRTCDAMVRLDYPRKEMLNVDDASTDNTVSIVCEYVTAHHFRLIQRPANRGVASARNIGIQNATGEVLVILNAIAFPRERFFAPHRQALSRRGALCDGRVPRGEYGILSAALWASVLRIVSWWQALGWLESGLFLFARMCPPGRLVPGSIPGASGEDVVFIEPLSAQCPHGVVDHSIIVPHVAPQRLEDFWSQYRGRGHGFVYYRHYFAKLSLGKLTWTRARHTGDTSANRIGDPGFVARRTIVPAIPEKIRRPGAFLFGTRHPIVSAQVRRVEGFV